MPTGGVLVPTGTLDRGGYMGDRCVALTWPSEIDGRPDWPSDHMPAPWPDVWCVCSSLSTHCTKVCGSTSVGTIFPQRFTRPHATARYICYIPIPVKRLPFSEASLQLSSPRGTLRPRYFPLSKLAFAAIVFVFWRFVFVFVLLVVGCLRGGLWVLAMPTSR